MQARAKSLITGQLNPAYAKFDRFYTSRYLPKCNKSVSVRAEPDGAKYYAFRVRQMTTTNQTPDAIHQIGLDEVARIRAEMDAVAKKAGAPSREAFIRQLRTDPQYYAKTPEELMRAAARMAKTLDGKMAGYFGRLPRLPYGVKEIPAETAEGTTTAYYQPGSPETGIAGFYYVNTSKLDQRPLWELPRSPRMKRCPAITTRSHSSRSSICRFRRHLAFSLPSSRAGAFMRRGWAMEMGITTRPKRKWGRLSYEMWRACRLVVDTAFTPRAGRRRGRSPS
jgi:uncharacterized protein (DUF885 family)